MAEVERPIVKRSLLSWVFDGNLGWQITLLGVIAVAVFTRVLPLEMQKRIVNQAITLRNVDVLVISPSEDLEKIAARHAHHLPQTIRFLLRGLGAFNRKGSNLVSYLLFERPYCRELINLGYRDAMHRKEEVLRFLELPPG